MIYPAYFNEHLLPKVKIPTDENGGANSLFHLTMGNDGQLPIKIYAELDVNLFGLKVLNVRLPHSGGTKSDPALKTPYKTARDHRLEYDVVGI